MLNVLDWFGRIYARIVVRPQPTLSRLVP